MPNYEIADILYMVKLGGITSKNSDSLVREYSFTRSFHQAERKRLIEPIPTKRRYYSQFQLTDKGKQTLARMEN